MGLLDDQVVAITGAGRGLGRAYALASAAEGAQVVVNDCGVGVDGRGDDAEPVAERVAAEIRAGGGRAVASTVAVGDEAAAEQLVGAAVDAFGRLDGLVNNAGIVRDRPLAELELADWSAVVDVHLRGTYLCMREAVRQMLEQGRGGRIVNTTSMAGLVGNPGQSSYAAAKAGIVGLTRAAALELGRFGIGVNAIAPLARTRLTADLAGLAVSAAPDRVAPLVVYLCSSLAERVTGRVFGVHEGRIFEYRTELTRGVDRGNRGWTPEAIADCLPAIGRTEAELKRGPADAMAGTGDERRRARGLEIFRAVLEGFRSRRALDWAAVMHFRIDRRGDYTLTVRGGEARVDVGAVGEPTCVVRMDDETFLGMARGELDGEEAFIAGRITASNVSDLLRYGSAIHWRRATGAVAALLGSADDAEDPG